MRILFSRTPILPFTLAWALSLDLLDMAQGATPPFVDVGGFVDTEVCLNSMKDADVDNDGALSPQEYATFASDLTKTEFEDFESLPGRLQEVYNELSEQTSLLTIPAGPDDTLFYQICRQTFDAAQPTIRPTIAPTTSPVIAPTKVPTERPTASPVVDPTATPTMAPTSLPTRLPTKSPTNAPTKSPVSMAPNPLPTTMAPTVSPTVSPTLVPVTPAPTEPTGPTISPTASPTSTDEIVVSYEIAIRDGINLMQDDYFRQEYPLQLIQAMNVLAGTVSLQNGQRQRRHLVVKVNSPTTIEQKESISCPTDLNEVDTDVDACESVSHEISVQVTSPAMSEQFQSDLERAMMSNFQRELDSANWLSTNGNPIILLDPLSRVVAADRSLSPGAIGGITAGALLLAIIPVAYFLYRRQSKGTELKDDYDGNVKDDIEEVGGQSLASDLRTDAAVGHSSAIMTSATLGASHADYGKNEVIAEPGALDDEASSNAGSSGWSSSAGISSLNTGSVDDEGATLAGLGVASAFTRNLTDTDQDEPPDRGQLDALIESGDWAAVGATAALLAAASDSQSEKSSSRADSQSGDAARAAELDQLVDAGDWEGVVAAAAKYESQGSTGTGTNSQSRTNSSMESGSGSATGKSTMTSSVSDSPSRTMKRQEVRAEVEALVRRVVPEEIDNVDEMMNQFKGREEELIETLRTMQERAVAQKARAAGHKAAKQEARQKVKSSRGAAAAPGAVVRKVASLEIKEAASGSGGSKAAGAGITAAANLGNRSSPNNARSRLEEAIEAGDWDAVGEAAAMISDSSVTTADTAEIQRLAGTNMSLSTTESRRSHMSGIQAERAAELDQLIDSGDWSGVAQAAKSFGDSDRRLKSASAPSKEEQDALKEAEAWMKIAEQTKGKGDTGASDAAEWAIQRSLTQLKKAEKKTPKKTEEDEV